jgi:hypothetical protein
LIQCPAPIAACLIRTDYRDAHRTEAKSPSGVKPFGLFAFSDLRQPKQRQPESLTVLSHGLEIAVNRNLVVNNGNGALPQRR